MFKAWLQTSLNHHCIALNTHTITNHLAKTYYGAISGFELVYMFTSIKPGSLVLQSLALGDLQRWTSLV